jgi:Mg/Co/Ni transporter MgtE
MTRFRHVDCILQCFLSLLGILVGAEVFGALLAGAWAASGLLELPTILTSALYGLALIASFAIMVPFMRQAMRVDPLTRTTEGEQE